MSIKTIVGHDKGPTCDEVGRGKLLHLACPSSSWVWFEPPLVAVSYSSVPWPGGQYDCPDPPAPEHHNFYWQSTEHVVTSTCWVLLRCDLSCRSVVSVSVILRQGSWLLLQWTNQCSAVSLTCVEMLCSCPANDLAIGLSPCWSSCPPGHAVWWISIEILNNQKQKLIKKYHLNRRTRPRLANTCLTST